MIEINSISEINKSPVELVKTNIKKKAEYIVFVEYITNIADVKTILEKKKKKRVSKFIKMNYFILKKYILFFLLKYKLTVWL